MFQKSNYVEYSEKFSASSACFHNYNFILINILIFFLNNFHFLLKIYISVKLLLHRFLQFVFFCNFRHAYYFEFFLIKEMREILVKSK